MLLFQLTYGLGILLCLLAGRAEVCDKPPDGRAKGKYDRQQGGIGI